MTPEGKVKAKVSKLLAEFNPMFYDMPVPGGYGKSTLDYLCCFHGRFFAIETKKAGGKPTTRQESMMREIRNAGGKTFVVEGDEGLRELRAWLADTAAARLISGLM